MRKNARQVLMLIGLVGSIAAIVLWWRSPGDLAGTVLEGQFADETNDMPAATATATANDELANASPSGDTRPDSGAIQSANGEQGNADTASQFRNAPASAAPAAFEAEAQLLGPPGQGFNVNVGSAVLSSGEFDRYMDALDAQASHEPLATDLTELYTDIASDVSQSVKGVAVERIVCGLKICLASGTAESHESFKPWQAAFLSNRSAPTHDAMSVQLGRGEVGIMMFRIAFLTDQASQSVHQNPGRQVSLGN